MRSDFSTSCEEIIQNFASKNFKSALSSILPLLDRSAKDLYQMKKVGKRFRKVIDENKDFIFWFNSNGALLVKSEIVFGGRKLQDILYSVRNDLLHDAELTDVDFIEGDVIYSNNGNLHVFNMNLVFALFLVVCYLPCNQFRIPKNIVLELNGVRLSIDELCGKDKSIAFKLVAELFPNRDFSSTKF